MIDKLLEGITIGMTGAAGLTWWLYPALEIFEKVKDAIHDVLSGENIKNIDEQSL